MKIGMVGLGNMGTGIAGRLNTKFGPIAVYNRSPEKTAPLVKDGAVAVASTGDLTDCDFVVSMLTDDRALDAVFLGGDGLASKLKKGAIHISMSTVSADVTDRLAKAHATAGSTLVAAPVLGRPDRAAAGLLFIIAAGPPEAVDRCQPLLDQIGQRTFRVGTEAPAGSMAKIAMNFMVSAVVENLSECFALTRKGGLDVEVFLELVTETIFAAPLYKVYAPLIARKIVPEKGSSIRISLKDVELALTLARSVGADMPTARMLQARLKDAIAAGYGDKDASSLGVFADESKAA